ncbi:YhjD/YihY/BrkB family envelope integrity protein [Methylophaga sp. OBS4]|uniref:YhjD/YihY/BrkB family envelope integrity protein n=1 Tax=Methylophaga sp. OBS4 TaxID=2991935 RepID=UPI00225AA9F6|nr:YhjD/YihY/BrkB family envelope integrity protein [Methylophaga sp. OBS4]MCX4187654.1 YihY/virulence factor BrkB family protein [Methylophaga sp. OBS4]
MTNPYSQRLHAKLMQLRHFFHVSLWQEIPEQASALWQLWLNTLRVSYIMIRELATGELNLRAMSLVFTTLLSLVPLIAVAFSVLKAFGVHNQMEPLLLGLLEPLGERGPEITANIIGFVQNVKVGVLGSLGLAMLFYTIIALVQKIENAFNFVWRVKRSRSLARRFTDYLSVVMIGPVLVFSALGLATTVLDHEVVQQLRSIEPFGTLLLIVTKLLPYIMIILAFTFLYKFIPNTKVNFSPALIGATVAGVLWISIGTLFASFVASSTNYTAIYSSFAILFFFMIWLYLAWFILLTGSQVAFYLQHPKLVQMAGKPLTLSPRLREKEGLWLMTVIARRFCKNQPPLTVQALEERSGLTNNAVQELLNNLEKGGLLAELAGEETRYVPAQDVASIKVAAVLNCLRTSEENSNWTIKSLADQDVNKLLQDIGNAQAEVLGDLTLRELAMGVKKHE